MKAGLSPRERVQLALSHEETDRVPVDFWAVPELLRRLRFHVGVPDNEGVLSYLQVDFRTATPDYIGPALSRLADGTYYDVFGAHRRDVETATGIYSEYASHPLAIYRDVEELRNYDRWPRVEWWDWDGFVAKCKKPSHYIRISSGGLFENAWGLRGMERFLVDMFDEPALVHLIMGRLTDYFCCYIRRALEVAGDHIDAVYTYDDIATQNSLLVSPPMWEEFVMPYHRRVNAIIEEHGKKVIYHSCGAVFEMIPKLIQLPIHVLNPLQPLARGMDLARIKSEFGNHLSFHGGIDIQRLMPFGTPDQVRETARRTIDVMGTGYVMCPAHYLQTDTPIENVLALYDVSIR